MISSRLLIALGLGALYSLDKPKRTTYKKRKSRRPKRRGKRTRYVSKRRSRRTSKNRYSRRKR